MKKHEIQVGQNYVAKVSNKLTTVRVDEIKEYEPHFNSNSYRPAKTQTRYDVTNLSTGRKTTFRSAAKFRFPCRNNEAEVFAKPVPTFTTEEKSLVAELQAQIECLDCGNRRAPTCTSAGGRHSALAEPTTDDIDCAYDRYANGGV